MAELGTEATVKPPQESEGPFFPPRAVEQSAAGCARPPAAFAAHLSACGRCFRHGCSADPRYCGDLSMVSAVVGAWEIAWKLLNAMQI